MKKSMLFVVALALALPASAQKDGSKNPQDNSASDLILEIKDGEAPKEPAGAPAPKGKCGKDPKCGGVKPVVKRFQTQHQLQAVVHNGFAYVEMNSLVQAAVTRSSGKPPVSSLIINGVAVSPPMGQIKMVDDVICVVSTTGANTEAGITKDDAAAIYALGVTLTKAGNIPGRQYLKIELKGPVDHLDIEVLQPKKALFRLTTILYF